MHFVIYSMVVNDDESGDNYAKLMKNCGNCKHMMESLNWWYILFKVGQLHHFWQKYTIMWERSGILHLQLKVMLVGIVDSREFDTFKDFVGWKIMFYFISIFIEFFFQKSELGGKFYSLNLLLDALSSSYRKGGLNFPFCPLLSPAAQ